MKRLGPPQLARGENEYNDFITDLVSKYRTSDKVTVDTEVRRASKNSYLIYTTYARRSYTHVKPSEAIRLRFAYDQSWYSPPSWDRAYAALILKKIKKHKILQTPLEFTATKGSTYTLYNPETPVQSFDTAKFTHFIFTGEAGYKILKSLLAYWEENEECRKLLGLTNMSTQSSDVPAQT